MTKAEKEIMIKKLEKLLIIADTKENPYERISYLKAVIKNDVIEMLRQVWPRREVMLYLVIIKNNTT